MTCRKPVIGYFLEFILAEAYLGPCQISMMEFLSKNSHQALDRYLSLQKSCIVDFYQGPKYASKWHGTNLNKLKFLSFRNKQSPEVFW